MKKQIIILVLMSVFQNCFAQYNLGRNWVTGSGISYKVKFANNKIDINYLDTNYNYYFNHGASCISGLSGDLKLLSNGYQLFDTLGHHIENGDSLVPSLLYDKEDGFSLYSQSSILLPFNDTIFYLITPTASDAQVKNWNNHISYYFDLLSSHKIDMSENSGAGKVVKKAQHLLDKTPMSKTQMIACRHGSGKAWWLLKQASDTNMVFKFLVTKDSIYNMGKQGFAEPHFGTYDLAGQSMFNQTGTQYATTCSSLTNDYLFVADFDRCSGVLSQPKVYGIPDLPNGPTDSTLDVSPGGMCFSPNGQFIYLIKYHHIFQLDLYNHDSATAWYHVVNLDTTSQVFNGYGNAYIGPDNKVYISNWNSISKQMSYINNPDIKGIGCNFCPRCLRFPKWGVGSVPCMPNYGLEKDTAHNCPLPNFPPPVPPPTPSEALLIYPNPSSGMLALESSLLNNQENEILILSMSGEKLYRKFVKTSNGKIEINISHLSTGLYILRVGNEVRKIVIE